MKTKRPIWIFRAYAVGSGIPSIRKIEVQFTLVTAADAADDVAECIRGNLGSDVSYYQERAQQLLKATGTTKYYNKSFEEFALTWQTNLPGGDAHCEPGTWLTWQTNLPGGDAHCEPGTWYGCTIDSAKLKETTLKALTKIAKQLNYDPTPQQVIELLRAKPAVYVSDVREFAPDTSGEDPFKPSKLRSAGKLDTRRRLGR